MLMENTYASFWQKKCYIFVKFSEKSAKRLCSAFTFLPISSPIHFKAQRTQAILSGNRGIFQQFSLKENTLIQ